VLTTSERWLAGWKYMMYGSHLISPLSLNFASYFSICGVKRDRKSVLI
jgi:hypothetical protein